MMMIMINTTSSSNKSWMKNFKRGSSAAAAETKKFFMEGWQTLIYSLFKWSYCSQHHWIHKRWKEKTEMTFSLFFSFLTKLWFIAICFPMSLFIAMKMERSLRVGLRSKQLETKKWKPLTARDEKILISSVNLDLHEKRFKQSQRFLKIVVLINYDLL